MRTRAFAVAMVTLALASSAEAQIDSFASLPLRINLDDTLVIVDDTGARIRGRLVAMTPTELVLRTGEQPRVALPAGRIREVTRRRRDPVRNGALIGLGSGAVIGLVGGLTAWNDIGRNPASYVILFSGMFAGLGTLVDAAIGHDAVVFRAPVVTFGPVVEATRRGVVVVLRW